MSIRECIITGILCLCVGLLIGLRQQQKQKDYMIKMLLARPSVSTVTDNAPSLPKIEELK